MTQVIHGLTREQLVAQVFNKSMVCGAVTTILAKADGKAESDARQQPAKGQKRGGF
ncbi:hypothetical protein [Pantoea vagans]|uniref:hypothetical protein n=1 Tax=Pantoea vagans TaxID=470934 RepID=UPI00301B6893